MSGPGPSGDCELAGDIAEVRGTCMLHAARRTANLLTRAYNQHLSPLGLEATQFTILCAVAYGRAASATELAAMLGIERSTLTRNLERLVAAGLVVPVQGEGRRLTHKLSRAGSARLRQALPRWRAAQEAVLAGMPDGDGAPAREQLRLLRRSARDLVPG
jgi:DNA-binding MarR family transcriptional regulator